MQALVNIYILEFIVLSVLLYIFIFTVEVVILFIVLILLFINKFVFKVFYMETVPIFTRLDEPIVYDNSIEATQLDKISCDRTSINHLNQANTQFKFYYPGDFLTFSLLLIRAF